MYGWVGGWGEGVRGGSKVGREIKSEGRIIRDGGASDTQHTYPQSLTYTVHLFGDVSDLSESAQ